MMSDDADRLDRRLDLGVGGLGATDADVVAHRPGEEEALLRDDDDPLAQAAQRRVAQVHPVEAHRTFARVVEADHELGQRRLPRAGRPDERDPFARRHRQGDVAQHHRTERVRLPRGVGRAAAVRERDRVDLDRAPLGEIDRARLLADGAFGVEQVEDLVQRRARELDGVVELAELLDRLEQAVQVQDEREHRPDRDEPLVDEQPTDADDDRDAEHAGELDEREVLGRDADGLDVRVVLRLVRLVEPPDPATLTAEGLHDAHAFEPLLQRREVRRRCVSRTSRYARFDSRRNQRLAKITGGTMTSVQSASCQLRMKMTISAPMKIRMFWMNITSPTEMSSCSASMSEVMRDTSRPVFSRS